MNTRTRAVVACVLLLCACRPAEAQTPARDGVGALLARLETLIQTGNASDLTSIVAPTFPADDLDQFREYLFRPDTRRAVVAERDRGALPGALPGDGYRNVRRVTG